MLYSEQAFIQALKEVLGQNLSSVSQKKAVEAIELIGLISCILGFLCIGSKTHE